MSLTQLWVFNTHTYLNMLSLHTWDVQGDPNLSSCLWPYKVDDAIMVPHNMHPGPRSLWTDPCIHPCLNAHTVGNQAIACNLSHVYRTQSNVTQNTLELQLLRRVCVTNFTLERSCVEEEN